MTKHLRKVLRDSRGATAIEYGLITAFIALVMVGSFGSLADAINQVFNKIIAIFQAAN